MKKQIGLYSGVLMAGIAMGAAGNSALEAKGEPTLKNIRTEVIIKDNIMIDKNFVGPLCEQLKKDNPAASDSDCSINQFWGEGLQLNFNDGQWKAGATISVKGYFKGGK